jgi:hypothetical protein
MHLHSEAERALDFEGKRWIFFLLVKEEAKDPDRHKKPASPLQLFPTKRHLRN